jgi:hypothetical protein
MNENVEEYLAIALRQNEHLMFGNGLSSRFAES